MKNFLIIIGVLWAGLSSCTEVYFKQSQPESAKVIKKFPGKWQGSYTSSNREDTLIISPEYFDYDGDRIPVYADSIQVKKRKGMLFVNTRDRDTGLWEVMVARMSETNRIEVLAIDGDSEATMENARSITVLITVYNQEDKDEIDYYLLDPSVSQLDELIEKGVFDVVETFYRY